MLNPNRSYEPSDEDVVLARLRTLGVQEYKIEFAPDNVNQNMFSGTSFRLSTLFNESLSIGTMASIEYGREWRLYDVGGYYLFFPTRVAFVLIII